MANYSKHAAPPRRALITGAASGIGHALAERLAGTVKELVLWDRNAAGLAITAAECSGKGANVRTAALDLSSEAEVASAYDELVQADSMPDFIFHAAGILHTGDLFELSIDDCRADVTVNYLGTVNVLVHAARRMAKGGRIVCVSSVAGLKGLPEFGGYCASKFAVYGFCESVRNDFRKRGIALSVLCPPAIDTPMVRNLPQRPALYDVFPFAEKDRVIDKVVEAIGRRDEFLILVDVQTWLLRRANGIAPVLISALFDRIIDWKRNRG